MNRARYVLLALLLVSTSASAHEETVHGVADVRLRSVVRGGPASTVKAAVDTAFLIGPASLSPAVIGTFEDAGGNPHWNGWTSSDRTVPDTTDTTWHVSTYYAFSGAYSAYCGDESIPSCGGGDPAGGYENSWDKLLQWNSIVSDPGVSTAITVDFAFDIDSEEGYDYASLARVKENEEREVLWQLSGDTTGAISVQVTYDPGEYIGENSDEIAIWFVGQSDGGWSDGDCDYPTTGLWRLDDVTITAGNGAGTASHDFEDGTLGPFERRFPGAVGDFVQILANLGDPDYCVDNLTPQVVFIDDGIIQPATGGSPATQPHRMYAGGWVVNYTGGLTFSEERHLRNWVVSPPVPWQDAGHDGARFGYGYMTDSFFLSGEAGVYMEWLIRSTDGDVASLEDAPWQHSPYVYPGGPHYGRSFWDVSDYLVQGRTYVQVALGAYEIGYVWGLCKSTLCVNHGSPSPYYDNVRLESFPFEGPSLSAKISDLPSDGFPEFGGLDTSDLSRNHIRFDMARNISDWRHEHFHRGDSIIVKAAPRRYGALLTGRPSFHYKLKRNPQFDPYRTAGLPDSGVVVMDTTFTSIGTIAWDRYNIDLPDTGFLFPGDVLHFHFSAEDAIGGFGGTAPFTSYLPADLTDYGNFEYNSSWSPLYTVRGLPSDIENADRARPKFLFWDDSGSEETYPEHAWYRAYFWHGSPQSNGAKYDVFYSKISSNGDGSGLGNHATAAQLGAYKDILYSSGDLSSATLSNGDWAQGGSDDVGLLASWLDLGERDLLVAGNHVAFDLANSGIATDAFLTDRMGVDFVANTHADLLGGQLAPYVIPVTYYTWPIFDDTETWLAYGDCPDLLEFDLVSLRSGTERHAEFGNGFGAPGGYPYSAVSLLEHGNNSRVVTMTHDPETVRAYHPNGYYPFAGDVLGDILEYFGFPPVGSVPTTPGEFRTSHYPNPFNPVTEIGYSIRKPGHLVLKIYNVRGQLVRTMIDAPVETGGKVAWDGTDTGGRQVASGVYFYEARMAGETRTGKMALVK